MAMTTFQKVFWTLAALGGLWAALLGSLTNPWLQRNALYAHKANKWWDNLNEPEKWGYLKNQIRPVNITTPDGVTLYAWHILPLNQYMKHEQELLEEPQDINYQSSIAFKALRKDPSSKVVVNFHGNAGHVGQGWRTDGYRAISAAEQNTHVIAFDYRGFGYSTGSPTEIGLIVDGVAVLDWLFITSEIQPKSVALLGQSLGTAVATAVAEHFATVRGVEFAGVVLVAAFSDLRELMMTYSIGWFLPILSPLNPYPPVQRWFKSKIIDSWRTNDRLASLIKASSAANIILIHAKDDFDIHYSHSAALFHVAANATSKEGLTWEQVTAVSAKRDFGAEGTEVKWTAGTERGGTHQITHLRLNHGGHNRVLTYPAVSKAIVDIFARARANKD